ncbi:phosphatidylserine/phosphatidylglycerophosphate/cardiolipin synthase family protein [Sphingomonas sp. MMS24-J13]|uniref:phospholipase D-like domain-containing protein n=1 Tax=Sphingomonas sp. MMS24-J13 TaxID=3238686 RepID=UPI00384CB94B
MEKSTKPITSRTFTVEGNHLQILAEGKERLATLIDLIDGAQSSLRLLYYIYAADEAGQKVRDALDRALKRGVTVALIVDGFGSSAPPEFFAGIHADGADVCRFLPKLGRRYLLRNHQKLALADERVAIIGGFNIENDYFDDKDGWRDLGLRIEGRAAARLVGYFDALKRWTHRDGARLRDLRRALSHWSQSDGGGKACWLLGGPMRRLSPWAKAIRGEIAKATRIDMIAAYFAPTPHMLRAIERVGKRGGEARIVTAAKSDNNATIAAARHTYHRLLRRRVSIFEYQRTKLHTKLFVIDDAVHIGSANFDVRSLFLNLEVMLRIEDKAFADYMRAYVDHEIAGSRAITRAAHEKATWWDRVRWSWAYWLVAVVDGKVTRRLSFGVDRP